MQSHSYILHFIFILDEHVYVAKYPLMCQLLFRLFKTAFCIDAGFAGTPGYLAPEVCHRTPYTKAVDVWAAGNPTLNNNPSPYSGAP